MGEWQSIDNAYGVRHGTIADLKMANGRVYRATWEYRGYCCAWWPDDKRRKKPIGLYTPVAFRVIAVGITPEPFSRAA